MRNKVIATTRRDGVICTLTRAGERLELTVVEIKTGAPTGTIAFAPEAAGAVIWTIQALFDEPPADAQVAPAPVESTAKSAPKKRATKNRKTAK